MGLLNMESRSSVLGKHTLHRLSTLVSTSLETSTKSVRQATNNKFVCGGHCYLQDSNTQDITQLM